MLLIVTVPGADGAVLKVAVDSAPWPPSASYARTEKVYCVPSFARPDRFADSAVPTDVQLVPP
jgi:hypothetical protein